MFLRLHHTLKTQTLKSFCKSFTTQVLHQHPSSHSIYEIRHCRSEIHEICKQCRVDDALSLIDSLCSRGHRPHFLSISSIIHALCDANRYTEAHQRFMLSVSSSCIPDERTSNVIIARLLASKSPDTTWRVVCQLLQANPDFVPSLMNYNRLINQFSETDKLDMGHRLMYHMIEKGHSPNVVTYTTLIHGYSKAGKICSAHKLFAEMPSHDVHPNPFTYSALIGGVLGKGDVYNGRDLMVKLWKMMEHEDDMHVNNAAFGNLIDSLCIEGFVDDVLKIAEEMPQGEYVNKEFAYGKMIDSLCRSKRSHEATRIVTIMKKKGLSPSSGSYNVLIHGLCKQRACKRAYKLFEEGVEFGYSMSEFTFKVVLDSLCRDKELDRARKVLEFMLQKRKGDARVRVYNIYLNAISSMSSPLNVLLAMLEARCQPDLITLNTVISGLCKTGRIEEAQRVLDDMMRGMFSPPDVVTFTTIIGGLLGIGRPKKALDFLNATMLDTGVSPNVVTYNTLLKGLFKLHLVDEALVVFHNMDTNGVAPNKATYSIVIDGLCTCDRLDEAKKLWVGVVWPSNLHDDHVYAAMIKGLCRVGRTGEACHFLYELIDFGLNPSVVCFNIAIDGVCNASKKHIAYQIITEMRRSGCAPDAVTWRTLAKLNSTKKLEERCESPL